MEGEQPQLGDLLSMVINHLLTGMTLQAHGGLDQKIKNFRLWILIIILPVISQVFRSNLRPRHLLGRREPLRLGGSAAKGLVFSRMSNGFLGGKISGKTEGFLAKRCKTTCHPQIKIQYIYICAMLVNVGNQHETSRKYRRENAKNLWNQHQRKP